MPQRPEDYMSTRNRGGNRKGGTDAATGDPFAYLKVGKAHAYLGHFRQDRFMREGHNFLPLGALAATTATAAPGLLTPEPTPTAAPGFQTPGGMTFPSGGGSATPAPTPTVSPGLQTPAPGLGTMTLPGGLPRTTSPRRSRYLEEHPVIAALRAGRQAIRQTRRAGGDVAAARAQRQQAVTAAFTDPQSRRMEVRARRATRQQRAFARFARPVRGGQTL